MLRSEFLTTLATLTAGFRAAPSHNVAGFDGDFAKSDFGRDFYWGVATSSFQNEGAPFDDGKGESIWDRYASKRGNIRDGSDWRTGSQFYVRYLEDLELLRNLNFRNFRFSFSWSRILPDGTGRINQKGLDFYDRMTDKCLSLGIEPWPTLYHWDLPQKLEDRGGWTNREVVDWFSEFSLLCTRKFGDRLKHWIIMNEPAGFTSLGYLVGYHAPARRGLQSWLSSVHHACLCQAEGGRIVRENVKGSHVGTTFSCSDVIPYHEKPSHIEAARRIEVVLNRLFVEPVMGMGYPDEELPVLKKMERYIRQGDIEKLRFDFDFIGLQYYFRVVTRPSIIPYIRANRVRTDKGGDLTEMGWEVAPDGLLHVIKQFSKYPVKEIIITENGAAYPDQPVNGRIHDPKRILYFKKYLNSILEARRQGMNVNGYFVWTFIDNFEWNEGYRPRFGIVYNDWKNQVRIVKDSGYWFRDFLK